MPRYINEDDFCEYIRKSTTPSGAEWTVSKIKDMPSTDAVEVVRCIDCKFCHESKMTSRPYLCLNHKGLVVIHADSFCSYGERKETE